MHKWHCERSSFYQNQVLDNTIVISRTKVRPITLSTKIDHVINDFKKT